MGDAVWCHVLLLVFSPSQFALIKFFLYIKTSFIFWNTILEETMRRSGQIPGIYTITARAQHFLNEAILYSLSQNWFFFIIDALSYTIKTFCLSLLLLKKKFHLKFIIFSLLYFKVRWAPHSLNQDLQVGSKNILIIKFPKP